ncbi:MAG: VacJ family lipoprotein [Rhodospirillales bacterium]|nr:VacJ family lipoprotein [Rhodospirillales bacterium]
MDAMRGAALVFVALVAGGISLAAADTPPASGPALSDRPSAAAANGVIAAPSLLERFNRRIFEFNRWAVDTVGGPSDWAEAASLPPRISEATANLFENFISEPVTIIAGLTAGDGQTALHAGKRFAVNTTLGVVGLFDVAEKLGLQPQHLDWGLAVCARGVGEGPYVVIPFIGPRTTRDALMDVVATNLVVLGGTYLVLGPLIGLGGVLLLQIPELAAEGFAFRQMDLQSVNLDSADYEELRQLYLANRAARCEQYKTQIAARSGAPPRRWTFDVVPTR